jgi:[ribosomal protein S5]-alanine N-acetyltransferase
VFALLHSAAECSTRVADTYTNMAALTTKRLILNPLAPQDADDLFEVRGDPEAMAFWDWPHDANPAVTARVIEQLLRDVATGQARYWAVRLRSDGTFVGLCDLSEMQPTHSADIGIMCVRRFWGLGLAQDAIACVLEHARALRLKSVHARIHSENARSARLLQRAGFNEVETIPDFEIRPGVYRGCKRFERLL